MNATDTPQQQTPAQEAAERTQRGRHWIAALVLLLLISAAVLPPLININRYQRRITASISNSLGRPVELSSVHLVLLPRPGFEISNFVVDEGPGFGAEPILQASTMKAAVRLLSLWRGRLEISRISLEEPSLNLVRNPQGYWNFASVLTQASRVPSAPTSQRVPGQSLRFPYIEASSARINFKYGDEKKPFSLLNADVAVWLENPSEWRVRFEAQPVRTDMHFSAADTGILHVSGAIQRAGAMGSLPLNIDAEWDKAPLGQISRLLAGEDYGWRADTDLQAHLGGTPDRLLLKVSARATEFHRVEFTTSRNLQLAATCEAAYAHAAHRLDGIHCVAPVGNGSLKLTGEIAPGTGRDGMEPDLTLALQRVPAAAAFAFLRHLRSSFSPDASVSGTIDGRYEYNALRTGGLALGGTATLRDLTLTSPALAAPLSLPKVELTASGTARPSSGLVVILQPVTVALGEERPLSVSGFFSHTGFTMNFSGAAALERLLPLSRTFALLPSATQGLVPTGNATMNVTLSGPWLMPLADVDHPALPSAASGSISLRDATVETAYLRQPLVISRAQGAITGDAVTWSGVSGSFGSFDFTGGMRMPLPCVPGRCVRQFDVAATALDIATLEAALRGQSADSGMVRTLLNDVEPRTPEWPPLAGTVRVGKLTLGPLVVANAAASLNMSGGVLQVTSFRGRTLGGTLACDGSMVLANTPNYVANIQLNRVDITGLSALAGEAWGSGIVDTTAKLTLAGWDVAALTQSAAGTLQWNWSNGGWQQAEGTPLHHFDRWAADGRLDAGIVTLHHSLMTNGGAERPVTGTISLDRQLHLVLPGTVDGVNVTVTGSFADPVITLPNAANPDATP